MTLFQLTTACAIGSGTAFTRIARRFFRIKGATARGVFASQRRVDHRSSAAYSRDDTDCLSRAISGAGPAFHAGVTVLDLYPSVGPTQDSMGADGQTHSTPHALFLIQL